MNYEEMSDEELNSLILSRQTEPQKTPVMDYGSMPEQDLDAAILKKSLSSANMSPDREVVDEAHPAIAWDERLKVKNFGGTPEQQAQYLQTKYPNLQIDLQGDEILAKGKNEREWRKLDPSSMSIKETLLDIGDVGYDIAAGLGEGAAAVGGAIAGGGVNPLTAAGAAGAAGAGLEALRQGIGQSLGMNEFDVTDAAITGAISGALTPLLGVGAGKTLSKSALKAVKDMGLKGPAKQEAAQMAMKAAQNLEKGAIAGALNFGSGRVAPKIAEMTSGVKADDWRTYFKHFDEIEGWERRDAMSQADDLFYELRAATDNTRKKISGEFDLLKEQGARIDVGDTLATFKIRKKELLDRARNDFSDTSFLKRLKKDLDILEADVFGNMPRSGETTVSLERAMNIDRFLRDAVNPNFTNIDDQTKKSIARLKNELVGNLPKKISSEIDTSLKSTLNPTAYSGLKKKWKDAIELENLVKDIGKDPASMYGNLMGVDTTAGIKSYKINELIDLTNDLGIDFETRARKVRAYKFLKDPSWTPLSGTATSTSRSILGGALGGTAGFLVGGGNPITVAAGLAAGSVAGSPASMRGIGKIGRGIRSSVGRAGEGLEDISRGQTTGKGIYRGVWNTLREDEE